MLTCIARSKQLNNGSLHQHEDEDTTDTPRTKQAIKALTSQVNVTSQSQLTYISCLIEESLIILIGRGLGNPVFDRSPSKTCLGFQFLGSEMTRKMSS